MTVTSIIGVVLSGLAFGSFAGAQVWRLRARQLAYDKQAGIPYDKSEHRTLRSLIKHGVWADYSRCLSCEHKLRWYDLIPLVSWITTKGRCRYCRVPIGWFEPLMEVATAVAFLLSYLLWPWPLVSVVEWGMFVVWLASLVLLMIMAGYDARWKLLPDITNYAYAVLGALFVLMRLINGHDISIPSLVGALAILAGMYGVLYALSRGAWIGLGDVKLGVGLALFLADWKLAFLALFLANLIGCIMVLPGIIRKEVRGGTQIPFGPLLMVGMGIAFFAGDVIIRQVLTFQFV